MKMSFLLLLLALSGSGFSFAQSDTDSPEQQSQLHDRKAQELLSQKRSELAAKEFAAALALDPRNLDARANLGRSPIFSKELCRGGTASAQRRRPTAGSAKDSCASRHVRTIYGEDITCPSRS